MSEIFISYKREEQAEARKLANALERQGWTVWWDPKLRVGEYFDDVIEAALQEANCVIVMWSKQLVVSRYVKAEAAFALDSDKLVPVATEDVKLPFRFRALHTPQLINWDGSEESPAYQKLLEDIRVILGPSPVLVKAESKELRKVEKEPPSKRQRSPADREVAHRVRWIRHYLLKNEPLSVEDAREAYHALQGFGGGFRAACAEFRDVQLEAVVDQTTDEPSMGDVLDNLRGLFDQVPRTVHPGELVEPTTLAEALRDSAKQLQNKVLA